MDILFRELGGEGEIRTRGGREPSDVFKTSALDHYATSPTDTKYIRSAKQEQGTT